MYSFALWFHSLLRWIVLFAGLYAWFRAVGGSTARRPWTPTDELGVTVFLIALDLQVLVGLITYAFISPFVRIAFQDFGAAMATSNLRFWAVEHLVGMAIGAALVHVGRAKVRKAADAAQKHRLVLIFFALGLTAILASIPWPGLPAGRPLLRF